MAIAFDTALTGYVGSATSKTLSITVGASSTLLVGFIMTTNAARTVSSVTWAGGADFFAGTSVGPSTVGSFKQYACYKASPTTGANNMVFTINAAGEIYCAGLSYTGTNTTQFDASNLTVGSLSQTITTATSNCWAICSALADGGALAASTNSTQRSTIQNTAWGVFDSNGTITTGGFTMTQTGSGSFAGVIVSIKEPGAAAIASNLMMLGIGS